MQKENSNLGEFSHGKPICNMLAYTINVSPKQYILPYSCHWDDCSPSKQFRYLKYIHRQIYNKFKDYLEPGNKVAFEFTKKGELHSHGFFRYKTKYVGYECHPISMMKYIINQIATKSRHAAYCRWVEDEVVWISYIEKESEKSGYKYYETSGEQMIKQTDKKIDFYLDPLIDGNQAPRSDTQKTDEST